MADVRYVQDINLCDPTTPSQQAAVDASGRLSVSLTASSATVTVDTELPAAAALADATANPTTPVSGALLEGYNGSTWDRLRTLDGTDAAPNVRTGILAVGVGPGFDIKFNPANLGTAANSAITNTVDGAEEVTYAIGTTTSGTYTFEVSADDSTWVAAQFYNKQTNAVVTGNITPTSGDIYSVRVAGWRQVRIRTVSTLGATMAVKTTH
ncbi:MAG TPA: hypothetical protein VFV92_11340, partial [Candidatus Bathyarchaeia archaeon]|nr:hypothetical protein [Candidatus Bathyarchaeia archaeon]